MTRVSLYNWSRRAAELALIAATGWMLVRAVL